LCEKLVSITKSQGEEKYPKPIKRREANWTGKILSRNCLLKHVVEGKITMTRGRGRGRKKMMYNLQEKTGKEKR
jgi:hypothetical protein